MPITKLPQPYALGLEKIRAKGYADREMLQLIGQADAELLKAKIDARTNWEEFLAYAGENADMVKAAVLEGYRFSFITIGGIRSLLSIRFNKAEGRDYAFEGNAIGRLKLPISEYRHFRALVPEHWRMFETERAGDFVEIRIELAQGK